VADIHPSICSSNIVPDLFHLKGFFFIVVSFSFLSVHIAGLQVVGGGMALGWLEMGTRLFGFLAARGWGFFFYSFKNGGRVFRGKWKCSGEDAVDRNQWNDSDTILLCLYADPLKCCDVR
jgi:hypothetical protein